MNDDVVVQKILKLLENNTAFIGYALNGGIGTKINVRNTETGKTIQALSINVDSSGEVLVIKDSDDGKYKAVTFKAAEQVIERIIQIRKTKPVDDKKIIEYTEADVEVFYLFVKLIDTNNPYPSQLQSTWIRKGSSCTQFVGAYERCNYAAKATISGTSYTGLPHVPYSTLQDCLNDDLGRDAKTPHGTSDENGMALGYRIYSTKMTADAEQALKAALESHDAYYGTGYKKLFGYGSILECSGGMYVQGWEYVTDSTTGQVISRCEFSFLPGFTTSCTPAMQNAQYCDTRGFINSKAPLFGQEQPGQPSVGSIDNTWGHQYGWVNLPYDFMYKRHFPYNYLNGQNAQGSFLILEVNEDQNPTIPPGYFPWVPGCPSNLGEGGPYDGGGGNRFPDGPPKVKKRDMKLSTHKAEIWLGSSKKEEALKIYELGASDLFSGMYNSLILRADETQVDTENRLKRNVPISEEDNLKHTKFYDNWNKNIIDLRIDPRVWVYVLNNVPKTNTNNDLPLNMPKNVNLQLMVDNLYNRTLNLTIVDKKTQVIHLKLGLTPKNTLSNTDCKGTGGNSQPISANDLSSGQSWEYQKYVTIKIKDWEIVSTTNNLDTTSIPSVTWNKNHLERKFFTSFGYVNTNTGAADIKINSRDNPNNILLRPNSSISLTDLTSGNHYEQYNYTQAISFESNNNIMGYFANSSSQIKLPTTFNESQRFVMRSTSSWWALWDKTTLDSTNKRLSSVVGYNQNYHQIVTNFGLSQNLNYTQVPSSTEIHVGSYWGQLTSYPLIYVPSNIRSVRSKLLPPTNSTVINLATKQSILSKYGLNYYFSYIFTDWSRITVNSRLDNLNLSTLPVPSSFYAYPITHITREENLETIASSGVYSSGRRLDSLQWFNRLWTQFIYDETVTVDVDSYKNVEFKQPTNPAQYIKYATSATYANSEYSFVPFKDNQTLETVLTPGVLDVTKQVKMTKPTNVDLDPNLSFLVYLYPFVSVIKKKKEI